jgi:radical SAM superfamily enzyme YgiQ (UPF0313 family)
MTVAALTSPGVDVKILDETVETLHFDTPADLVGIGSNTSEIVRAYEICDEFKRRGKTVVMGGIHVSALPEEALTHADSIVIGEAEDLWEQLLHDFRRGRLKKIYQHQTLPDLKNVPIPNRQILKGKKYLTKNVCQVSRGCPYRCIFCSVTELYGNKFRVRDVNRVITEIETMKGRFLMFLDDNIFGDPVYAAKLMQRMIPLRKKWVSQCTLGLADNQKLLDLAVKSGCIGMLVGLESVNKESLKASGKPIKFNQYADRIRRIIDSGIHIDGSFVLGFDNEDVSIFEKTLEFILKIKLSAATFSILTPYPGTSLLRSLEREKRIIDRNWEHYNGTHAVFQPAQMTPEQLEEGRAWIKQEFYGFSNMVKRIGFRTTHAHYLWLYNLLKQGGTSKKKNRNVQNPN